MELICNEIAARLYMVIGKTMPENASDEWFLETNDHGITIDNVALFTAELEDLVVRLNDIGDGLEPSEYQTEFYDSAKRAFGDEKASIRMFFRYLYALLFWSESGPRWGEFVAIVGTEGFENLLRERSVL